MSNPWFRLHTDFLTNDRIQLLSFDDQRHYVAILCLKCRGSLDKFKDDAELQLMSISKALGLDPLTADEVRFRLMKVGLLDENWEPMGWGKRQYQSDTSAARVAKHRAKKAEKKQSDKPMKRSCNVTVTPPDTDTDTEADTEKDINQSAWADYVQHRKEKKKPITPLSEKKQKNVLREHSHAVQQQIVDKAIASGWTALYPPDKKHEEPSRHRQL